MTIKEFYADRIVDFIKKYGTHIIDKAVKQSKHPYQLIKSHILKHLEYQTIVVVWDKGNIAGICAFNIIADNTADIIDCIVHPDYRFKNVLKRMTAVAVETWPRLETIQFERPLKGKATEKQINIAKFLGLQSYV